MDMTLHRQIAPCFVAAVALLLGCGESTLEPIGQGGSGADNAAGGDGAGAASGPGGGGASAPSQWPDQPLLIVVTDDEAITAYETNTGTYLPYASVNTEAKPYQLAEYGDDLLVAGYGSAPNSVEMTVFTHFINQSGVGLTDSHVIGLDPVGGSAQIGVDMNMHHGSLWMVSLGVGQGTGSVGNRLYMGGYLGSHTTFTSHEATPALGAWTVLPNHRTVVASTTEGLVQIRYEGIDNVFVEVGEPVVTTQYTSLAVVGHALYAVTPDCASGCTGELHIWRHLAPQLSDEGLQGGPDLIIELPDGSSSAYSLSVGEHAVVVGTIEADPQLFVFREPGKLAAGAQPTQALALSEGAFEIESVHWKPYMDEQRLSVFVRGPSRVMMFDQGAALPDPGAVGLNEIAPNGALVDAVPLDILVAD
jgi:hypothetical protein